MGSFVANEIERLQGKGTVSVWNTQHVVCMECVLHSAFAITKSATTTYSYKTNEKGFFVTRCVKDRTLGAAVKSVRETEETRSRLPQGLWAGVLERN